jgi:hypothetical protein
MKFGRHQTIPRAETLFDDPTYGQGALRQKLPLCENMLRFQEFLKLIEGLAGVWDPRMDAV